MAGRSARQADRSSRARSATRYLWYSLITRLAVPGQSHHSFSSRLLGEDRVGDDREPGMACENSSRLRGMW